MTDSTQLFPPFTEEMLPGGGHRSFVLKRGQLLRLTDIRGGANVSLTLLNANEKTERLNLPDTLKAQHTAHLTTGNCAVFRYGPHSRLDQCRYGRLARPVVRPDRRRIDPEKIRRASLSGTPQRDVPQWQGQHAGRTRQVGFGAARSGDRTSICFPRSWSMATASFNSHRAIPRKGDYVELRFEMDTLVALSTAPTSARSFV
jgi:hypothetical protein